MEGAAIGLLLLLFLTVGIGIFIIMTRKTDGSKCTPSDDEKATAGGVNVTGFVYNETGDCVANACVASYSLSGGICTKDIEPCSMDDLAKPSSMDGGMFSTLKNTPNQTLTREDDDTCVPDRQLFSGNNGTVSCDTYCAGTNGKPWNTITYPQWKGAKCVGVANKTGDTWSMSSISCNASGDSSTANKGNVCVCERSDSTPWAA